MELLAAGFVMLVALMVYEPAVLGAVEGVLVPLALCKGAKEPPAGVRLQVTPEGSLVVTERLIFWPSVSAAARGARTMEMLDAATLKARFTAFCCAGALLSVTAKVSGSEFTAVCGVPEMTPLEGVNDSPAGNAPAAIDQVSGGVPPLAVKVAV